MSDSVPLRTQFRSRKDRRYHTHRENVERLAPSLETPSARVDNNG
jgi:hypothetical protein